MESLFKNQEETFFHITFISSPQVLLYAHPEKVSSRELCSVEVFLYFSNRTYNYFNIGGLCFQTLINFNSSFNSTIKF